MRSLAALLALLSVTPTLADRAAPPLSSTPLSPSEGPRGETLFDPILPAQSGIDFSATIDLSHPLRRLYHGGFAVGGVAVGDFDNDGRADVFFASGPDTNRLYRQTGPFRFEDVTESAGVGGGETWGTGAVFADFDADGDLDLYVCNYDSPNQLFVNSGGGSFIESAVGLGVGIVDASFMPSFADFDNDGDLDLHILTNQYLREGGRPQEPPVDMIDGRPRVKPGFSRYYGIRQTGPDQYEMDTVGRRDYLLENLGPTAGFRFRDATERSAISAPGFGLSATWWDYDADGWLDLYVTNDYDDPDHLYRNRGDGSFEDVIAEAVPHTPWFSMGSDAGDLNNDGWMDLIAADMSRTTHFKQKVGMGAMGQKKWFMENAVPRQVMRNAVYLNAGAGRFMEIAHLAGLASSDWTWAVRFADLDADGWQDCFASNGSIRDFTDSDHPVTLEDRIGRTMWDHFQDLPENPEQNLAFRNGGDLRFSDTSAAWGLDHTGITHGVAFADLDNDGDLDAITVNANEPAGIYRNGATANRIAVRLAGKGGNRRGLGAFVTVRSAAAGLQSQRFTPVRGYQAGVDGALTFGLGADATVEELTVRWPGGAVQRFVELAAGNLFQISEPPEDGAGARPGEAASPPMFARSEELRIPHTERPFDDFSRQPLLPHRYSQLGPGMAWADVDGDGDSDFYLGRSAGAGGMIGFNEGRKGGAGRQFQARSFAPFDQDADCEDMAPLFFDADGDGDEDLYIASGSYEFEAGDPRLKDRLYLNAGDGAFTKAPAGTLPGVADFSATVAAADFDRDGDLDLFVGGRMIPGRFPDIPTSRLLINGGGRFSIAPEEVAPGLGSAGLVTGAVWSDADGDGWIDLLVSCEWGPLRLFRNDGGTFSEQTEKAGLAPFTGWWNSIAAGDIDADGDIDYAAGNLGLNTKYHASPGHPSLLFAGDFAGDGTHQLIEAEFEGSILFPMRGKSCSTSAMPHLADRFKTFRSFARASVGEIYPEIGSGKSVRLEATTLESGVFLNDGTGKFEFRPFPPVAQASPIYGIQFADVDADGAMDLYAVQNSFSPQLETGRYDGGLSILLRGSGSREAFSLEALWPAASGLLVPADAKSLTRVDLDGDRRPDFVVGVNSGEVLAFENRSGNGQVLEVRLAGADGNPTAIGSRVILHLENGETRISEVRAGGGYLSQNEGILRFGLGGARPSRIEVRWPDGERSEATVTGSQTLISQP